MNHDHRNSLAAPGFTRLEIGTAELLLARMDLCDPASEFEQPKFITGYLTLAEQALGLYPSKGAA